MQLPHFRVKGIKEKVASILLGGLINLQSIILMSSEIERTLKKHIIELELNNYFPDFLFLLNQGVPLSHS